MKVSRKNAKGQNRVLTASGKNGLVDQRIYFNKAVASEDTSGYYLLKRGEFAYNRSAMDGYPYGAIKRLELYEAGVLSTLYSCFALRNPDCDSDFFVHLFELGILDRQLRYITHVGGRAHGLLNVIDSDFFGISIPLPPHSEQRAIAAVLAAADEEIAALESKLTALEKQKKGLMQKLLTGEVRVKI
jgi:type I restriction enzyme S subunit